MRHLLGFVLGAILSVAAMAAVTITESQRVTLLRGSYSQSTAACPLGVCPSRAVCKAEQRRLAEESAATSGQAQYFCQNERDVLTAVYRPNPPPPVDCVVDAWSAWTGGEWQPAQCPSSGVQTREETRTRSVLVQPANGGLACPALSEIRTASQTCTPPPPPSTSRFFDDFEYVVNRNDSGALKIAAFTAAGWNSLKDETTQPTRARGFLSTVSNIPGYMGPMPGGRALKLEGLPTTISAVSGGGNQTDFYLQYGRAGAVGDPNPAIPGDVCFDLMLYVDPASHFANRNKLIYPSEDGTQSGDGTQGSYLISIRPSNQAGARQPYGPNIYGVNKIEGATIVSPAPEGPHYIGDNLSNAGVQLAGAWYQHRFHVDHSQAHGVFEHWIRPMGGAWIKTAEWRSGVTPGFTWLTHANQRVGANLIKIPTTWGTAQTDDRTNYDVTAYVDKFTVSPGSACTP